MSERDFLRWRPDDDPGLSRAELESELGRVVTHGRRRRARRTAAIGSSLALVLVVGVAVAVQRPDGQPSGVTAADPGTTTSTVDGAVAPVTAYTTTTTALPQHPRPPFVVVAREVPDTSDDKREIALLDSSSGKHIRTIYRDAYVNSLALSPDGKYVYFIEETCGSEPVKRISVDGPADQDGERLNDIPAASPSVSPNGRFLAYKGSGDCDGEGEPVPSELRVRNLATGAEQLVAVEPKGYSIGSPTWSPDGTRIALDVNRVVQSGTGGPDRPKSRMEEAFIVVVDPTTRQDLLTAPRLTSPRTGFGFDSPEFLPDGALFVVETQLGDTDGPLAALMLVIDGHSAATLRQIAVGDPKRRYSGTASDATGSHLLYISSPGGEEGVFRGGEVRVSTNGTKTTVLARNVTAADW